MPARAPAAPSRRRRSGVAEQPLERSPQRERVARRHEQARSRRRRRGRGGRRPRSRRPAGRAPSPRRRRRRSPRGATGRRRPPHARSSRSSSSCGTKPSAPGTRSRSGPSPGDDQRQAARRLDQLEHALLSARAGRRRGRAAARPARRPSSGTSTPLGITRTSRAPSSRAASASSCDAQIAERGPAQDRAREPRRAARQLDVRAPELDDERAGPVSGGDRPCGQPVRVDEIGAARGPARRPRERDEHRRQQQREPGPPPQVAERRRARRRSRSGGTRAARRPRPRRRRSRSRSTASATKRPTTSSGERGYDVVRTMT